MKSPCFLLIFSMFLIGCSGNDEDKARGLFVAASKHINDIKTKNVDYSQASKLHSKATQAIDELLTNYSETQFAYKIISTELLISGYSYSEFQVLGNSLKVRANAETNPSALVRLIFDANYKDADINLILLSRIFLNEKNGNIDEKASDYVKEAGVLANNYGSDKERADAWVKIAETLKERGLQNKADDVIEGIFLGMNHEFKFFSKLKERELKELLSKALKISGPSIPYQFIKSDMGSKIRSGHIFEEYAIEFYTRGDAESSSDALEHMKKYETNSRLSEFDRIDFLKVRLAGIDLSQGSIKKGITELESNFNAARKLVGEKSLKEFYTVADYLRKIYHAYASNGYIDKAEEILQYSLLHGYEITKYKNYRCSPETNNKYLSQVKSGDISHFHELSECGLKNEFLEAALLFLKENKGLITAQQLSYLTDIDEIRSSAKVDLHTEMLRINSTPQANVLRENFRFKANLKMSNYLEALKATLKFFKDDKYFFGINSLSLIGGVKKGAYSPQEIDIIKKITQEELPISGLLKHSLKSDI